MIDFPATPGVGSVFSDGSGRSWTWDGVKWTAAVATGGAYVAKTGDTMSGPLLLSGDPSQPLGAATKQYVDANYSGFVNRLRNGTFDLWQRGTPVNVSANGSVYTADGWIVGPTGAACAVAQGPQIGSGFNSMQLPTAAGMTTIYVGQRIESSIAVLLQNKRVTVQFKVWNQTGATITPNLVTYYPNAQDNWGVQNSDINVAFQPCPDGAVTTVAYTFTPNGLIWRGYWVLLYFPGGVNIAGKTINVGDADIRVTPNWPVGLCANPPPPELRPLGQTIVECQRYYQTLQGVLASGYAAAGVTLYTPFTLPVRMRAVPTVAYSSVSYGNGSGLALNQATQSMLMNQVVVTAAGVGYAGGIATLSAEL